MSIVHKTVRFFLREINYNASPSHRPKLRKSLRHSLRCHTEGREQTLQWDPELSCNNLILTNGRLQHLGTMSNFDKQKLIDDIMPPTRSLGNTKKRNQLRQAKCKLKKLVNTLKDAGNHAAAGIIKQIIDSGDLETKEYLLLLLEDCEFTHRKSRLKLVNSYIKLQTASNDFINKNATYVTEGVFKIPHKWNVGSDVIPLERYINIMESFLKEHFAHYPIKAIVGHADEKARFELTGDHVHYYLNGQNQKTMAYDLRKRKIKLVNDYIRRNHLDVKPFDETCLSYKDTPLIGHFFQLMIKDYMNKHLLNPLGLNAEFSDETQKRSAQYQQMVRESKLPKAQRQFNYYNRQISQVKERYHDVNRQLEQAKEQYHAYEKDNDKARKTLRNLDEMYELIKKQCQSADGYYEESKSQYKQEKMTLLADIAKLESEIAKLSAVEEQIGFRLSAALEKTLYNAYILIRAEKINQNSNKALFDKFYAEFTKGLQFLDSSPHLAPLAKQFRKLLGDHDIDSNQR